MATARDGSELERHLRVECARLLLAAGRWVWPLHVVSAAAGLYMLWPVQPPALLVPWALVLAAAGGLQGAICVAATRPAARPDPLRAVRAFDLTALVLAVAWGVLGGVLFPSPARDLQYFVGFMMGGAALVGVGTQHMHYRTLLLSLLPSFPPYVLRQSLAVDRDGLVVGTLLSLFLVAMLALGRLLNGFITRSLRLQFEQDRLLERLSRQATELAAARAAADEANVAKSRFLAQASHDLRQPLHAIGLLLESLPDEHFRGRSAQVTTRIRESLAELSELFNALLDVTLLDTGQVKVERTGFRLGELLARTRDEFSRAAAARGIALRVVATRATVWSDPMVVRRMLHNLVSNALQHSGGRRIVVGVRRRGGGLVLQVHDDGQGIPVSDQRRIFGEFTRLETGPPGGRPVAGLGLGLAIVERLAEMLAVDVGLRSTPGRGSVFSLGVLPRAPAAAAGDRTRPAAAPRPLNVTHVLVVDDDQATREATASLLRKWGCAVDARPDWPGDGAPATARPDVVICDWALGLRRNALDAIGEIRAVYGGTLPAVVITGDSTADVRARAAAAGLLVLHKPVRPGQLRSALLHAVARSGEPAG